MNVVKQCRTCHETKQLMDFYRNNKTQDGYLNHCKECHSKRMRDWRKEKSQDYTPADPTLTKPCSKCHVVKAAADFGPHLTSRDGLESWCRTCRVENRQKWEQKVGKEYISQLTQKWYAKNAELVKDRGRKRHRELREQALRAYSKGDPVCACCGEQEVQFLGIDHIDGGGAEHRRQIGATNVYYWAKINGYPPGLQVLCHNCNLAKGFYGVCPHQKSRE